MRSIRPEPPDKQFRFPWRPPKSVSTSRAAELLGVSASTIIRMCQTGELESFKRRKLPNSPLFITYDSICRTLDAWKHDLNECRTDSASGVPSPPSAPLSPPESS